MLKRYSVELMGLVLIATGVLMLGCGPQAGPTTSNTPSSEGLDRTVLPIHEPARQTYKELDARNAKAPTRWEVKAPKGAPNVVVVLIDDMGFGASSRFGGPVNMPVLDKLASGGLSYTRFHTTSL